MAGTFLGLWSVLLVGFASQAIGIRIPYRLLEMFEIFLFSVALPGFVVVDPFIPYGHGGQAIFQLVVAFLIGSFLIALVFSTLNYGVKRIISSREV